ncbi:thiamine pyrophosphate-dependent enzyme [Dehalococcoidia bacterium]|nr:thiamine pyrophosphate-dependent enzyme [Dehalococcoidia bacterium]
MSATNPEYDFKWCPGCGDFGVRRALEFALGERMTRDETPIENNVIVAGIGCSGNLTHLLEGPQPYGFHGIHGRTLPIAMGIKMSRQDLNVIIVAGDGDFLSIGMEHIAPQAARNLDVCAVIMDNGVYGLTKGQSSPTTELGVTTSSTPYGKFEEALDPLDYYLTIGVSFIASGFSSKPRDLAKLILAGMDHPGFAIIHVQSPCTTYNDNYELLKGNVKKGIQPLIYNIPVEHDPTDHTAAYNMIHSPGLPIGILYHDAHRQTLGHRVEEIQARPKRNSSQELLDSFQF